jgi:PAP2 superfamily
VDPFGLISTTQFLPVVQPQLESAEYAIDFNDVKDNGSATSATRTERQTALAQLFANAPGPYANVTSFFRVWHNVARDVSQDEGLDLVRTARLFALLTASINDSLITSQTSKFIYRLWRPETAIAAADIDGNDATDAEAGWAPLLGTPPYPSHASNASCIGTSAAQTLVNVFGTDAKSFTATWYTGDSPPAVVHAEPYNSFWAMAQDTGSSRVWGGIHFRFEITASEQACTQVANYVFDNYMQRRRQHHW